MTADTEDKKLARLKRKLALRLDDLEDQAERQFIKQRLLGQIDALEWVIGQIHALSDKDEPAQPPVPPIPAEIQEILSGLERAGEQYHVSTSGKKIYVRSDGQWVEHPKLAWEPTDY
jgi:hypothetical protein